MARRFAVLLDADDLGPEYRWRLVTTLFAQRRSLTEGNIALAATQLMCLWRTGWPGFAALAVLSVAVTVARLILIRAFDRRSGGAGTHPHTPELWARRCIIGVTATSLCWCATNICVFFGFHDAAMQLFAVMVQAGWLSAANVRNAPSPRAVLIQTGLTALSIAACAGIAGQGIARLVAPFSLIMMSASLSIAAYMRAQSRLVMLTEQQLGAANEQLTRLSATDALTGIGNRRAFDAVLQTEWGRAMRQATDLALLVIDVDHFKRFNDRYGHPAGDVCLRHIAGAMESTLRRPPDFPARFGGEEFVAVLPGTSEDGALGVAERLCLAVRNLNVPHEASSFAFVTISVGVASMAPSPGESCQVLIDLADQALYDAKQNGRNQPRAASARLTLNGWSADGTAVEKKAVLF